MNAWTFRILQLAGLTLMPACRYFKRGALRIAAAAGIAVGYAGPIRTGGRSGGQ